MTRIPCLLGLPSTHTLGANVASRVCCAVWQRSDELTRSLGVHWLCFACLVGEANLQHRSQTTNYHVVSLIPVWVVLSDRRFIRIHQARVFERFRCLLCLSILSFGHVSSQKDCQTVCKNCKLWLEVYVLVCAVSSSIAFRFSLRWRKFERTRACLVACECASVLLGFKLTCFHWKIGWIVDESCIVYDSLFCECSLALPKNGQPDLCQCSIGPGVRRTTLKVNSFCCSFSHRWPGVGRTQRECSVGVCDKNSLPSWPSEHSYPWGQRCQQGLLCRMTAKRWANAFAGGALIVLCVLGRGGQSTAQKPNYKLPCCKPHSCLSGTFG